MTLRQSRFFSALWKKYIHAPSIALCRVPELEFAASLPLSGRATLDHCCGDGIFAELAWPGETFTAGCDLSAPSIDDARKRGRHLRADVCDAAVRLPYEDASFDLVFNNSALEHIPDIDATLREIARVTRPAGTFAFNVLNHRYFEWWPENAAPARDYREWQPFIHAFDLAEWTRRLESAGFHVSKVHGYFDRHAARTLARFDSEFSGYFIKKRPSELVTRYQRSAFFRWWTRFQFSRLVWTTEPDAGAGYYFLCTRS